VFGNKDQYLAPKKQHFWTKVQIFQLQDQPGNQGCSKMIASDSPVPTADQGQVQVMTSSKPGGSHTCSYLQECPFVKNKLKY
jgi:hypothetical protein